MGSKQYFNEVAPAWDKLRESFFTEKVREKAISIAMVQSGKMAADIGVGTGFIAEGIIERGLNVLAIDQSIAMLYVMKHKVGSSAAVEYCVGDAENLPLCAGAVDYVFANMCLHHVERPWVAISEMVRILDTGGRLVITDLDAHSFEFLKQECHDRWMGFKQEDITEWFVEARLKNVELQCIGERCCAQSGCTDECASIGIFVASGEK